MENDSAAAFFTKERMLSTRGVLTSCDWGHKIYCVWKTFGGREPYGGEYSTEHAL